MKPTCPFKTAGFDQPDTCDENCAWLMRPNPECSSSGKRVCAVAMFVLAQTKAGWVPANYWNEED